MKKCWDIYSLKTTKISRYVEVNDYIGYQKSISVLINSFAPSGPVIDNHTILSLNARLKSKKSQQALSDLRNEVN